MSLLTGATVGACLAWLGWLVIEHDDTHGSSAQALVAAHGGFTDIADHDDLTGRPRFVTARRAPRVPE